MNDQAKKNTIVKKLERYLPIKTRWSKSSTSSRNMFSKSRSWHSSTANASRNETKRQVAPSGCFSVYVGPEKRRFVVKTEFANHPLFKMLLEDAELEYGFKSEGPLQLPCEVDLFCKVLAEMDSTGNTDFDDDRFSCGSGYASCSPYFSPKRRSGKGYGSYDLLTPSRLLKINNF